jgi:purine-cytosine permease-like protein
MAPSGTPVAPAPAAPTSSAAPTPPVSVAPVAPAAPTPSLPGVPQRRSLPEDTLMNVIAAAGTSGGTLEMMAELESQLHLREEEAQEYKNWERSMLLVGTEEAIDAVRQVRPQFEDVVPEGPALPVFMPRYPVDAAAGSDSPDLGAAAPAAVVPPAAPEYVAAPSAYVPPAYAPPPLIEPPVVVTPPGSVAAVTGSLAIIPEAIANSDDIDPDAVEPGTDNTPVDAADTVAESDRVFAGLFTGEPAVVSTEVPMPLSASADQEAAHAAYGYDDDDDDDAVAVEPQSLPAFAIERSGQAATPVEARSGHAVRMFWLWFATNASIVSVGFGASLFALGMSLRQSLVAILVGVAASCLPLGLATIAGKRSGQPTMIISRAAFGVVGNIVPALLALVTRIFWGALLLWVLATSVAFVVVGAQLGGPFGYDQLVLLGLGAGFIIALLVAFFGYTMVARFQLVISIFSFILIVGLIVMTWSEIDLRAAVSVPDGNWLLAATGAVLVFSYLGLAWAQSGSDLARYQRVGRGTGRSMVWSVFGATLPPFVLIGYGALLAASNPTLASGLIDRPLDVIAGLLPIWYPVPLIAAIALSLISGVVLSLYSAGFAIQSVGIGLPRHWATFLSGLLVAALAWFLTTLDVDLASIFRDVATTIAVPVAAWAGIFAADTMIRNRLYHEESLLSRGGIYPTIHWVNLPMFFVITGIGFGFTTATVSFLSWQGYLFPYLGISVESVLAATDVGVFIALLLGILTPIVAGIPGVRRQESWQRSSN